MEDNLSFFVDLFGFDLNEFCGVFCNYGSGYEFCGV